MADRANELRAEKENVALKKLQEAAGLIEKPMAERLDWMYEQSAASVKKTEEEKMNTPIECERDKDIENIKDLNENTAGSLFLKSATKTNEDMLRKLREDPLFQIRREEQNAKQAMMSNPLVVARMNQKAHKVAKKEKKKAKKVAKKEKKKEKKASKKLKKAAKKGKSSSSDSSSDSSAPVGAGQGGGGAEKKQKGGGMAAAAASAEDARLGPSSSMKSKREEREELVAKRKDLALASRGACKRMDEEERKRKLDAMMGDAAVHDRYKDRRIADAEKREKEQDEKEERGRQTGGHSYLSEVRKEAYSMDGSVADRLKSQRHRRGKDLKDNLERD